MKSGQFITDYIHKSVSDTYADALRAAVEHIKERRKAVGFTADYRCILFVPDKYTLLAEKLLYSDNSCSFFAEVLTLNRLCYRIAEYDGEENTAKPLSRLGAILTVRRILGEQADNLIRFKNSVKFDGFGETMYDNICQLAASGLSAADLPDDPASVAGHKLHDIKLIYSEYEKATAGKYVDSAGRLLLLNKTLDSSEYFDGAEAYFACYDGFTPLQERIVKKICAKCGQGRAAIFTAKCMLDVRKKNIEEYAASSPADELKAAAVRIRNLALKGVKYSDMGVISASADYNRLKRIFREYGIPFFTDVKYALSCHPLARYLLDLFAAANSGTNERYIRLSKNPYAGISRTDADIFENYVFAAALGEGSMNAKFEFDVSGGADDSLSVAESVRARLNCAVKSVKKSEVKTGADFIKAIERVMPSCEREISAGFSEKFPNAREEISAAVAVIGEVYARPVPFNKLLDALKECFALKEVAVLPNLSNTVEVGDVSVFRASAKKYLFVLGMHEGEIPQVMRDDGILSDADLRHIAALGDNNAVIEPSIATLNRRAEEELYSVLSSSENLFLSYSDSSSPSPVLARIKSSGADIAASNTESERFALSDKGGAQKLLYMCPTRESALEMYLINKGDEAEGGRGYGFDAELKEAVGEIPEQIKHANGLSDAKKIYLRNKISVSRVQEYFSCPFRCFMRYGLKAAPRPDGEVSPLDLGTFLHRVIELFIAGGDYSAPDITVPQIVEKIRREEPRMLKGASDDFIAELTEEAVNVSAIAAEQLLKGDFKAEFTEAEFGKKHSPLKGSSFILSSGDELTAEGVIDRLDILNNGAGTGGKGAARVVDYKTGFAEFSYADIYFGRKIQLAVYMKIARENGYEPVGMFYFPFSSGFAEDEYSHRLKGIFDVCYAREMDRGLCEPDYASTVVAAKAAKNSSADKPELNKRSSSAAVTKEVFAAVCDYAERVFKRGAEEMLSGYCAPSPLVSGRHSECSYCEMKPCCISFGGKIGERKKSGVKPEFIARCVNGDGTEEDGRA